MFQRAWNATAEANPAYQQVLYTDEDVHEFITSRTSERLQRAFFAINPKFGAARADIFRYALLYEHGGVYLDIKSSAEDIDSALRANDQYLLSKWNFPNGQISDFCDRNFIYACETGEYEQWWIIAAPRHPFLKRVLENVIAAVEGFTNEKYPPSKDSILRLTGPTIYTISIDEAIANGCTDYRFTCNEFNNVFHYSKFGNHIKDYEKSDTVHYSQVTEAIVLRGDEEA